MTGGAAVRLAWRQARGGGRHLAVVCACIALGVGALVAVGTLGAGLEATLAREAKSLLGGDVELRAARPLPSEAEAALERLPAGAQQVRVRELVGMVRGAERDGSLLVELKAVSAGYPLYGRLTTVPGAPLASLLADDGAVVQRQAARPPRSRGRRSPQRRRGHAHDPRRGRGRAGPLGGPRQSRATRVPVTRRARAYGPGGLRQPRPLPRAGRPAPRVARSRRARDAGARDRQPGRARGRVRRGPAGPAALLRSIDDVPGAGGAGQSPRRRHRCGRGDGRIRGPPDADPGGLESASAPTRGRSS